MKFIVIVLGFWEGDSYLVHEYIDCAKNVNEAITLIQAHEAWHPFKNAYGYPRKTDPPEGTMPRIFLPETKSPEETEGRYGTQQFFKLIEKEVL